MKGKQMAKLKIVISDLEKEAIIQKAKYKQGNTGRKPFDKEYYAAISFLYVDIAKTNSNSPTDTLAKLLDLPKRTMVSRLATARKLNILTPNPIGTGGGKLTLTGVGELSKIVG